MIQEITKRKIDIVLPAYNPHLNWEKGVAVNFIQLKERFPQYEFALYVATDGSVRGFEPDVVEFLNKVVPGVCIVHYEENRGKGFALRSAVSRCDGDWTVYIDHDFPYTLESIDRVFGALSDGADVVIATRSKSYQKNLPPIRKLLSYASHFVNRAVFMLPFSDTQGGMKGFNRVGRKIFMQTTIDTFLFDTQFIYKAVRQHADVRAVESEIKRGLKVSVMGLKVVVRELKNIPKVWI